MQDKDQYDKAINWLCKKLDWSREDIVLVLGVMFGMMIMLLLFSGLKKCPECPGYILT